MDLRAQTSLLAGVLALAIATTVVLRGPRRRVHWLFGWFGLSVGLWYLSTSLGSVANEAVWRRVNLICAVLLPVAGVQFFRAFIVGEPRWVVWLNRGALGAALGMVAIIFTPFYAHRGLGTSIVIYVVVTLVATLAGLFMHGRRATSRFEGARLRYLVVVGALATTFTLADYLPYLGLDVPPVGTVLTLTFLYALSQSVLRYRLLDLYELFGRLGVLLVLSFTLAFVFWMLVQFAEDSFFLHCVAAVLVVLLLFDPLRARVEEQISQIFFRQRHDLEKTVTEMRRELAHVLELDALARTLMEGLERSRRVTHASLYLVDEDRRGYNLSAHVGPQPVSRVEIVPARPLFDRIRREDELVLESLERELEEVRSSGDERDAEMLVEITHALNAMNASVCVPLRGESQRDDVYGLLTVRDERLRDAFSPEEIQLLRGLAAQAAIAVENSRLYQRMKERDRLAALGEMAAGLAHEIRNPLGAIKASAQYLSDPPGSPGLEKPAEFLDIIVEEVDRLNRVVSAFLEFARPSKGDPTPTDVHATVQRTMQLLATACQEARVEWRLELATSLPSVRIDMEQLRQVLINLVQNAIQAMRTGGILRIETERHQGEPQDGRADWVEIRVTDTGPGILAAVQESLFVPFVTTKDRGTGLGLAISKRLVNAVGGDIYVRSRSGVGCTFTVRLPIVEDGKRARPDRPVSQRPDEAPSPGAGERPSSVTLRR